MFKRAFTHVHDTNEGDDVSFRFYVWQLGYALFPWTGLVPAGLVCWLATARRRRTRRERRLGLPGDVVPLRVRASSRLMLTKFHHYIFPAVPPAAMLTGILLDRMLGESAWPSRGDAREVPALARLGARRVLDGASRARLALRGSHRAGFRGSTRRARARRRRRRGAACIVASALVALAIVAGWSSARAAEPPAIADERAAARARAIACSAASASRRRSWSRSSGAIWPAKPSDDVVGQARLIHLFTYNYRRPWPDSLDFSGALAGFTIVAVGALRCSSSVARLRRHVVGAAAGDVARLGRCGALDVYLVKASPHWGQREIDRARTTSTRESAEEPLVAYQMNWKGENFYTGNHIPAFVSSGANFTNWLKTQQDKGDQDLLLRDRAQPHERAEATKPATRKASKPSPTSGLNNKFCLVQAPLD